MLDAYAIGVRLSVLDHVSPILRLLSTNLGKTGTQVSVLEKKLKNLQGVFVAGGVMAAAGAGILASFRGSIDAAVEYDRAFGRFKQFNLGDAINQDATKFAKGAGLFNVSSIEMMDTIRDLHSVFGDYDLTKKIAPVIAQLSAANQALFEGKGGIDEAQAVALGRFTRMRGGTNSVESFLAKADIAQKIVSGSGGNVTFEDLRAFAQRAGSAGLGLSDEGLIKLSPMIQEMKGTGAGTAYQSIYRNFVGGVMGQRAADEAVKMGLLNPSAITYSKIGTIKKVAPNAIKDSDLFKTDFVEWARTVLIPQLASRGITSQEGIASELNVLSQNRTGANIGTLVATQMARILVEGKITKGAKGINETITAAQGLDAAKLENFNKQWTNLKIIIGEGVMPAVLHLATSFANLFKWLSHHETVVHGLEVAFAGLGAVLLLGGTGIALSALVSGFVTVLGFLGAAIGGVVLAIGSPVLGVIAALAAFGIAVYALKRVLWPDNDHTGRHVELDAEGTAIWVKDKTARYTQGGSIQPPIIIYNMLDGKEISKNSQNYISRDAGRASRSTPSLFDPNMNLYSLGIPVAQ